MPNLFQRGEFQAHSGETLEWKIDCDALSDDDVATLARIVSTSVGSFSDVEGVPRGGTRLARALTAYMTPPTGPLLIVDDVCTTGRSMEEHRNGREAVGFVIFSRGGLPSWAQALFTFGNDRTTVGLGKYVPKYVNKIVADRDAEIERLHREIDTWGRMWDDVDLMEARAEGLRNGTAILGYS